MAKRLGMSRSEFFRRAVEDYIESHRNDAVREALDTVYGDKSPVMDDALSQMQYASLPEEDW